MIPLRRSILFRRQVLFFRKTDVRTLSEEKSKPQSKFKVDVNKLESTSDGAHDRTTCTMIPGDGVGPELVGCLQDVFKAINVPINFDIFPLSEVAPVPNVTIAQVKESIKKNKVCIKGTLDRTKQLQTGVGRSYNKTLIDDLDIFANVSHIHSLPGIKSRYQNVDIVIIREQTEGEYSTLEHESVGGVVECLKIITERKSKRIAKFAFDYATKNKRKHVTAVHKANIMKLSDGLFLRSCEEISTYYPRIKFDKMIVDNTSMQLVARPNQFDVMVTPNLYGNIIGNLASGLIGGAGVVAGATYSSEVAIFEPGAHHTFFSAVGKSKANPTAMLLSGCHLLRHINLDSYAKLIEDTINDVLQEGILTEDVGGTCSTKEFTDAVISQMKCSCS